MVSGRNYSLSLMIACGGGEGSIIDFGGVSEKKVVKVVQTTLEMQYDAYPEEKVEYEQHTCCICSFVDFSLSRVIVNFFVVDEGCTTCLAQDRGLKLSSFVFVLACSNFVPFMKKPSFTRNPMRQIIRFSEI